MDTTSPYNSIVDFKRPPHNLKSKIRSVTPGSTLSNTHISSSLSNNASMNNSPIKTHKQVQLRSTSPINKKQNNNN